MLAPAAKRVQRMFDAISPRYDFLNHLLSAGIDRHWRTVTAERVRAKADGRGAPRVLDLCTGTGDLAFAVRDAGARVVGADFSLPMLRLARDKSRRRGLNGALRLQAADALRLPFRDGAFDACTVAFGLRNVVDPLAGLREMRRVLRPGGWGFVLEFGNPRLPGVREAYGLYFHRVLPCIGRMVSRSGTDAYHYLPRTVAAFPDRESLASRMREAGFEQVSFTPLTCGIAVLYEGRTQRGGAALLHPPEAGATEP